MDDIARYELEMAESDEEDDPLKLASVDHLAAAEGSSTKPITLDDDDAASNADSDIQVIAQKTTPRKSTLKTPSNTTPKKNSPERKKDEEYPPYATYKYEVEEELAWDYKTCKVKSYSDSAALHLANACATAHHLKGKTR